MRKAIIVDDEKMIRIGIKKAISWETLGIDDVFLASGAKEALDIISGYHPEVMISDINMPEMTGLELIQKARDIVKNMKIIILTGYDKFEFARDSIRLHVDDFLLKPVDEDDLTNILRRLVDTLNKEQEKEKLETIHSAANQFQIEAFMRRLVCRKAAAQEIDEFCSHFLFPAKQPLRVVILVPPLKEKNPDDISLMEYGIKEICMGLINAVQGEVLFTDIDRNTVLVLKKSAETVEFSKRLRQISSVLEMEFGTPPQMFQGETVNGYYQLAISYNDAQNIKKENQYIESKDNYSQKEKNQYQKWEESFYLLKTKLMNNVNDLPAVLAVYSHFVDEAKAYNLSSEMIGRNCFDLVSSISYQVFDSTIEKKPNQLELFLLSIRHGERDDIFLLTWNFIERLLDKSESKISEIVSQAKVYINEHLTENLSVASIAEGLYVTPNYFSRLFKSITGEGCNDYIVRKRIEKAENLLINTNMKAGKIAEAVGYNDANYFSLAFKKNSGLSPTQFRERERSEEK